MNEPMIVDYYSDILCVWAWIAQRRIDELNRELENKIEIQYYYVDVFGDVATKIATQWEQRGGYEGYAIHVQQSAAAFECTPINPKIWAEVRPSTSANAHLVLKAVELTYGKDHSAHMALQFRKSFFVDALDVSNLEVLFALVKAEGLDHDRIIASVNNGSAIAALMNDYQRSKQQSVKGSPSYVIDGGRQTLYGNVGYRVLLANIGERLRSPSDEASWC